MSRAKSWCKKTCSQTIDEKFDWCEDEQKRVYIPEFSLFKHDLKYLNTLAKRKKMSPSLCLEVMIRRRIVKGWGIFGECYRMDGKPRKRLTSLMHENKVVRRKYMIHPIILGLLQEKKEEHDISYSVFFEKLIGEYRCEFPLRV